MFMVRTLNDCKQLRSVLQGSLSECVVGRAIEHTFKNSVHGRDIIVKAAMRPTVCNGRLSVSGGDHFIRSRQISIAPEDLHTEDRRLTGLLEGVRNEVQKRLAVNRGHSVVAFALVVQVINGE